jgi:hypothetical protein
MPTHRARQPVPGRGDHGIYAVRIHSPLPSEIGQRRRPTPSAPTASRSCREGGRRRTSSYPRRRRPDLLARYLRLRRLDEPLLHRYVLGGWNRATASSVGPKLTCRCPDFSRRRHKGGPSLGGAEVSDAPVSLGLGSIPSGVERRLTRRQQIHIRVNAQIPCFGFLLVLEPLLLPLVGHRTSDLGAAHTTEQTYNRSEERYPAFGHP